MAVVLPIATAPVDSLSPLAAEWRERGSYFSWESRLPENEEFGELDVFHIEEGNPADPAIVFIHGYPTSSFDYYELFELLRDDYYVLALGTPGYGLSDKPRDDFAYSIEDDALLVDYYVREVVGLESFAPVTHDKGNSVGLAFLDVYSRQSTYDITHHVITNGNIYLPLAALTRSQRALLSRSIGGGGLRLGELPQRPHRPRILPAPSRDQSLSTKRPARRSGTPYSQGPWRGPRPDIGKPERTARTSTLAAIRREARGRLASRHPNGRRWRPVLVQTVTRRAPRPPAGVPGAAPRRTDGFTRRAAGADGADVRFD